VSDTSVKACCSRWPWKHSESNMHTHTA